MIFLHGGDQFVTTRSLSLTVIFLHGGTQIITFNNKIFKFNSDLFAWRRSVCNKIFKFNSDLLHRGPQIITRRSLSLTVIFLHGRAQFVTKGSLTLTVIFLLGGAPFVTTGSLSSTYVIFLHGNHFDLIIGFSRWSKKMGGSVLYVREWKTVSALGGWGWGVGSVGQMRMESWVLGSEKWCPGMDGGGGGGGGGG